MTPLFATAYLPPIAYVAQLSRYERITIEQMETFHKQTYRNRAVIVSANGLLPLIVPTIHTHGNHTMTRDMGISYKENWNIRHLRAIESAYSASPYYLYYKDELWKILETRHDRLTDLNQQLLSFILKKLSIKCEVTFSSDFAEPNTLAEDYRTAFSIKGRYSAEQFPEYSQVFSAKMEFQPNVSILDLLFNMGPEAKSYLGRIEL